MIKSSKVVASARGKTLRVDSPPILMPSPHFNVADENRVFEFFSNARKQLCDRSACPQSIGQTIRQIYGVLRGKRDSGTHQQWRSFVTQCRQHPIVGVLHEDEFSRRAYAKPRGYAGDAVLLDFIYGCEQFWTPPEMSWIGQRIHRWTTVSSACEGVKSRRGFIADLIDDLANQVSEAEILSLASGHFREAEISAAIIRRKLGRIVAIDSDVQSLGLIDECYGRYGVQTIEASARELITGRLNVGEFDLIYSSGLCDYLTNSMCQRLAKELFAKLKPGGKLVFTNFLENIEGVGYMEAVMDWNLIYRDRVSMMEIAQRIPSREIAKITVFCEENHNVIFLVVERGR